MEYLSCAASNYGTKASAMVTQFVLVKVDVMVLLPAEDTTR
jgi:hypothetical protein